MSNQGIEAAGKTPENRSYRFAKRMEKTPRSFIREILKVTQSPGIISFAGGLPNPALFDTGGIAAAAEKVLKNNGSRALQYAPTEGDPELRAFIAERYRKRFNLTIPIEEILITNGSQQCLDLVGKVLVNPGDRIAMERPGYLGAIQAFSLYEPEFLPVPLRDDGPDLGVLERVLTSGSIPLMYGVPNSQNPSGVTYTRERRRDLAAMLQKSQTIFVEDDAYGELTFSGEAIPPVMKYLPCQTILTGSFSKILSPGMRLGWICAPSPLMEKIVTAKQASDLHSNFLSQQIATQYLQDNDIDDNIRKICDVYSRQCSCMLRMIERELPEDVKFTRPQGGMFTWVTLPEGCPSMDVFNAALRENVAVLPGIPFYTDGGGTDTLRLNFSNSSEERIRAGISRLGNVISSLAFR